MPSYMFDTNIFNRVLDGVVKIARFRGKAHFYATHVQLDELKTTSNTQRRQELIAVFEDISGDSKVPTESFVLGVSRLDEAKLGDEKNDLYSKIKAALDKLNKNKPNNIQDALIAETAIKNQITLVTEDSHLLAVVKNCRGKCVNINEMLAALEKTPHNKLSRPRYRAMLTKLSFGVRQAFLFGITSLIVAYFHDFLRHRHPWRSIGEFLESWFSHSVAILLLSFIAYFFIVSISKFFLGKDASEIKSEKVFVYVLLFLLSGIVVLFLAWALVWRNM